MTSRSRICHTTAPLSFRSHGKVLCFHLAMWRWFNLLFLFTTLVPVTAQLAITEASSSAGTTQNGTNAVAANSDWWELTNFGTNDLDLTGYRWNDNSGGLIAADSLPFQGLTIHAGESIIFVENTAGASTNEAGFRAWWGSLLNPALQIRFYTGNGLSSGGDSVRLWAPNATSDADDVDTVDLGSAIRGFSFTYNTNDGSFVSFSTNGINGAFKAETSDDFGSPGTTAGPVPLSIIRSPTNQSVNAGDNATFTTAASGLPRARFQWRFNGADIAGARFSAFTVTNVQAGLTGRYDVVIYNGFQQLTSAVATLSLNAAPEPPSFILQSQDQVIFVNQSATFTVAASGVPQPVYHWRFNGNPINGVNTGTYTVSGVQLTDSGTYTVVASNSLGRATNQAILTVTPRPKLIVTEICPAESTNGDSGGHNDWWEVSNFDTFAVDLFRYQLDDSSTLRAAAFKITNHVIVSPGESVILVEGMSPKSFTKWWGAANLKTNLQIISYSGSGLGLSSLGDGVVLWNPGAVDDSDYIAAEVFSTATPGVTFGYNPDTQTFGDLSVIGQYGGFRSVESDDIGSPGYVRTPPEPRLYRFTATPGGYDLTWYGLSNRTFAVEYKDAISDLSWIPMTNIIATGYVSTVTIPALPSPSGQRFFRLSLAP